jgi:2-dehydro-3-deoxyphosphogluconate aldolase/(4S)-4-hydroxy-2-oxoglutarate aldolase
MTAEEVQKQIRALGVVPVVAIESTEAAVPFADALIAGGLPLAEITFRTEAAAGVMRVLREERPDLLVGAGTVLTADQVYLAKECGAKFAVAPGFNPEVVKAAQKAGLPFAPGIMTPSDIEGALSLGLKFVKFFPAGDAGGPKMLKSLSGPYAHTGVSFMPTGGVSAGNLAEYLSIPTVLAVGGTWIAKKDAIAAGDWDGIAANCREALKIIKDAGLRQAL